MTAVNSVRVYTHHDYRIDTDAGEFDLEMQPVSEDAVVVEVVGDTAIVGYLVNDEDCPNPLEDCDGMGHIYSSHRHSSTHAEMQDVLGLDGEWEPDLDLLQEEAEIAAMLEAVRAINDNFGNGTTIFAIEWDGRDYGKDVDMWNVAVQYPNMLRTLKAVEYYEWKDGSRKHLVRFRKQSHIVRYWDDVALELWREGRKNGTIGNKYAVSLDVYEHSGTVYSVSGEGMQCVFDTAHGGAVWVPDGCLIEDIESYPEGEQRQERVIELARQACEEYTSWCNGDCYGVVVEMFKRDGVSDVDEPVWTSNNDCESVWGFIGYDYAEKEMESEVKRAKEAINVT